MRYSVLVGFMNGTEKVVYSSDNFVRVAHKQSEWVLTAKRDRNIRFVRYVDLCEK